MELPLYPGDAPGSEGITEAEKVVERGTGGLVDRAFSHVHRPTVTVYLPEGSRAGGTAIVIAPGGAYRHLAIDKEGHDVARWLASQGIAGLVLKYRLPRTEGHRYSVDTALADARQAMRLARSKAGEWGIARIGMMGFSAGGNLTALAGTKLEGPDRPDFLGLIYPSVPEDLAVPADVPPSFLVHADDDRLTSENSVRFYLAAKRQKAPAELHIYSKGGHGFGIRESGLPVADWPGQFLAWLKQHGLAGAAVSSGGPAGKERKTALSR